MVLFSVNCLGFCSVTSLSIYNRVIAMVRTYIEGYIGSVRTLCPINKSEGVIRRKS